MKKSGYFITIMMVVLMFTSCEFMIDSFSIDYANNTINIESEENFFVDYKINPEGFKNKIEWSSSNPQVATIDKDGQVVGISKGKTQITGKIGKFEETFTVVVESKDILTEAYENVLEELRGTDLKIDERTMQLGHDKSYIRIETKPHGGSINNVSEFVAFTEVALLNVELGFKESLFQKMNKTSALDGKQIAENDLIIITWAYHPDKGLSVLYELKD